MIVRRTLLPLTIAGALLIGPLFVTKVDSGTAKIDEFLEARG